MTDATPYTVPKEPGRWRAITLAALVHVALLTFLWIGVHWQNETPVTIEAEIWSPQPREAAPAPQPENQPEPQPIVKAPPPPPAVEPPVEKPAPKPPEIALEQEKKRKAELEKKRAEEQRVAELKDQKRREEQQLAELKEKKRLEDQRLAMLKEQAEQKNIEKEKADKAALAKKAAEEKKRKQDETDTKSIAKMREENMRRMTDVTGSGGSGDAPKSQGGRTDGGYAQRVAAKIKSNINFNTPEGMEGNPPVEFEVNLLPDGSIAGIRKRKSSGIPGFDEAVSRAIEKSQPYPKDKNGSVPSSFIGVHKPKDQ